MTGQTLGGTSLSIAYQMAEGKATVTDRRGQTWKYQHDQQGHPTSVEDPLGHILVREYEPSGALIREVLPGGRQIVHKPRSDLEDQRARGTLNFQKVIPDSRGPNGSSLELITSFSQYNTRTNAPSLVTDPRGVKTRTITNDRGLPEGAIEAEGTEVQAETSIQYNDLGQPVQTTNANGHVTRLEYYQEPPFKGFLRQSIVDPGGLDLKTVYEWDLRGYPAAVIDPRGIRHEYVHNEMGWLVEEREGVSGSNGVPRVRRYSYDRNGNVDEVQAAAGDSGESFTRTQYEYGNLNEVLEVRTEVTPGAGDFVVTSYGYDAVLNRTSETGPNGQATEWTYDARNLPLTVKRGVGETESTETFEYDAYGQVTSHTDGEGKVWRTVYDGYGRVAEQIDPLFNTRKTRYDDGSNPVEITGFDSDGTLLSRAAMEYDERSRLVAERHFLWDPQEEEPQQRPVTRTYTYDAGSNLTVVRDERNFESRIEYDKAERQIAAEDALGNRIDLTLDPIGNAIKTAEKQLLPGGGTTLRETHRGFNALGLPVQETDATGRTTQWVRDVRGNVRLAIDGAGLATESVYDGVDRLVRTTLPDGTSEAFGYDASSRRVSYKDALGQETRYVYDKRNRLLEQQYPDQTKETYSYDLRDLRVGWGRPNGTQVTETYDDAGRLTGREIVAGEGVLGPLSETYAYDGLGRLTRATSGDVITERRFDSLSRMLSEKQGLRTVRYAYDDGGNQTQIQYPSGPIIELQSDALGRPSAIIEAFNAGTRPSRVAYGYQGTDQVVTKAHGAAITGTRQYDAAGSLIQSSFTGGSGQLIFQESVTWNARGLKTAQSRGDLNGTALHFTYDGAGRLTQAQRRSGLSETSPLARAFQSLPEAYGFTYDKAHNLLAKTEERLCGSGQVDLPLDGSGRNRPGSVGGTSLQWNANGNLKRKGDLVFHYDWRDRLVRVTPANGGAEIARYHYDAFDRRVAKEVDGQRIDTVWDDWQPIEEYRQGQLTQRRVYGLGLDEIVSLEIDLDHDGSFTEYIPYYDETGNLAAVSNALGKVIERYEYSPFGDRTILVDSTPPSIEQVRVKDSEIWITLSEEVPLDLLNGSVTEGTFSLEVAETGANLPITLRQPAVGSAGLRRLVVKLTSPPEEWPASGTLLRLTLPAAVLQDAFGNTASAGTVQDFAWTTGDALVQDGVAPRVQRVCVANGKLEIELSEEPDLDDLATIIQLNGAPASWTLAEDRLTLVSVATVPPGTYELSLGTQPLDLAGLGLAETFQKTFIVGPGESRKLVFLASLPGLSSSSAIGNLFGFHGLPLDPETGLVYVRHRYYDPELGRFITTDPMGYVDGGNLYQYSLNNPANFTDPTGEVALVDNIIGGVVGVGVGWGLNCLLGSCDYTLQDAAIDFGLGFATSGLSALGGLRHVGQGVSGAMRFTARATLEIGLDVGAEYVRSTIRGEDVTFGQLAKGALLNFGIGEAGHLAASGLRNLRKRHWGSSARLNDAAAAVSSGNSASAFDPGQLSLADIMKELRQVGTPQAHATAKILKRGEVKLEIVDKMPAYLNLHRDAVAAYRYHSKRIFVVAPRMTSLRSAAGFVAHEVRHFIQQVGGAKAPSKSSELDAYLWQGAVDRNEIYGEAAIRELLDTHPQYRNLRW